MFNQLRGTVAPLPAEEVAAAYAPFGRSRMLPAAAYVDPAVFAWEQANFFAGWVCLGRGDDLAEAGSQTRRHRRRRRRAADPRPRTARCAPSPTSAGTAATSCCPCGVVAQQARDRLPVPRLDLPARRLAARRAGLPGRRRTSTRRSTGWSSCRSVEWHGWVFVNASGRAAPFAEHVGELEADRGAVRAGGPACAVASHDYEVAANWKVVVENYHECYHCPLIHPELCAVSPPASGDNLDLPGAWVGGSMDLRDEARHDVARRAQRRRRDRRCATPSGARCSTSGCSPTCSSACTPTTS